VGKPRDDLAPLAACCGSSTIAKNSGTGQAQARFWQSPVQVSDVVAHPGVGGSSEGALESGVVLAPRGREMPPPLLPSLPHRELHGTETHQAVLVLGTWAVCIRKESAVGV